MQTVCILLFFTFGLCSVGVACFGIYSGSNTYVSGNSALCSLAQTFYNIQYGTQDSYSSWLGVEPVKTAIENFDTLFKDVPYYSQGLFQNQKWINTDVPGLLSSLDSIYFFNNRQYVRSPNPTSTNVYMTPDFIKNLGPAENSSTTLNSIETEILYKGGSFVAILQAMNNLSNYVNTGFSSIYSTFEGKRDVYEQFVTSMEDYQTSSYTTLREAKTVLNNVFSILMMVFAVAVLGNIVGCFGIAYAKLNRSENSLFFLNISWLMIVTILIFSLFLCLFLFPLTLASIDICRTSEQALIDNTTLNRFPTLIRPDLNATFYNCFYQNGDVLQEFGFNVEVGIVQNFSSYVAQTDAWKRQNTGNMTTLSLTFAMQSIYNVLNFTTNPYSTTDINDPSYVLNYFNTLTDSSLNTNQQTSLGCTVSADNWVVAYSLCRYKDVYLINTPSAATTLFGSQLCIRFQDFDSTKIGQRYTPAEFSSCGTFVNGDTVNTRISSYFTSISNYIQDVNNVFSTLLANFMDLTTQDAQVWKDINLFLLSLAQYKSDMTNMFSLISDSGYGLIPNTNCTFFRRNAEQMYTNMCVNLLPMVAQTTFAVFAISLLSMITGVLMFFLKSRVYVPKPAPKRQTPHVTNPLPINYGRLSNAE